MIKKIVAIFMTALSFTFALDAQDTVITLDKCLKLARENDPYLKNARLDAESARMQKSEALFEYFPTISATAAGYYSLHPFIDLGVTDIIGRSDAALNIAGIYGDIAKANGLPERYTALQYGYGAGVSFTQPVYAGGRIINANRLAALGVRAADLKRSIQERETDDKIEQKFWQVVSLIEKRKVLDAAMELISSLEKDAESAYGAGLVTESDCLQVRLKKSELKSAALQLDGGMKLAKMDLFNAIGVEYSVLSATGGAPYLDDFVFETGIGYLQPPLFYKLDEEVMASAMEESKLLDVQVEAKQLEKKMELGSTLPQVALGGMYGYGHLLGYGKPNGAVFAMVSIPISDWGKTSRRLKRYENEVQKARNEQAYLQAQLLLKARQMWINLETAWDSKAVAEEAATIARDSYEKQLASYGAGLITMSDLLQAQTELTNCENMLVEACIGYSKGLDEYLSFKHE